jgi:hypothetical protein
VGDLAPFLFAGAQGGASLLAAQGEGEQAAAIAAAARYNASMAERSGSEQAAATRKEGVRALARRRSAVAKSGIALEGTALDAMVAEAYEYEKEALYAERAGAETARLDRRSASTALRAGRQAQLGTILSGAGQAGAVYYGLTRPRLGGY